MVGLLLAGAAFLVYFAISSPELPPNNLVSTLDDVAGYYQNPGNSSSVVLPLEEDDWVTLSAYDEEETQTGAGTQDADRSKDIAYQIRPGETLSEIAYSYNVPYDLLAFYNSITNPNRIRVGTVIQIPSLDNMRETRQQMARQPRRAAAPARNSVKNVRIAYESRNNGDINGPGITVQFSIVDPPPESLQSFEWEFGDGKRGFRPNPSYEYTAPRTYVAKLTARDAKGAIYRSNPLYIDIPHPGSAAEYSTTKFVTLSSPDDFFVVRGTVTGVARYPGVEAAPLDFSESDQYLTKVRFTKPGFYGITVQEAGGTEQYYSVFVSPIPTIHADASQVDFNWYRTQYNTGTTSNCGPASASMAIGWSLGKYFPVSSVRQAVGWQGEGGTSFEELLAVIRGQGIDASIHPLRSVQHIKDVIDSGSIAVVLFRTDGVRTSRADPATDLFGKYYNDTVGHYIVIKGYSLNGEYFVIYDPIPSDWGTNSFRYSDEVSMIGRNRYYAASELLRALRRADMIVVPRSAGL
ncbi:MAG: LysM peptidoglycan-binding domain-containing protein [Treponema sp.]|nr:LysM peptidoglycan-binding domain-containing protein [Treponema sp.]